jgi:2-dehydropantoate 2-reductase
MRILIYGAGPLGSLFAARLHAGGHQVAILARGQRLADILQHGIVIQDVITDHVESYPVPVVDKLDPDQPYDLIMVIMRKNNALDILPVLAQNSTADVLFLMNNAAGPGELVNALGKRRVLTGFPAAAGYRQGHTVCVLAGTEREKSPIPFGEVDGTITRRTHAVAQVLDSMPGFKAEIRTDMDAWSKYHVALLMPSLAPAMYMCNIDNVRMANTRDAVVLAIRAIREGFAVLRHMGYPITPKSLRIFAWIPEPILVAGFQKKLADPLMETALIRHANAARDEIKHLADEFMVLARSTGVPTPNIDRLYPHLDEGAPLMPEGSRSIALDWHTTIILGLLVVSALFIGIGWSIHRKHPHP